MERAANGSAPHALSVQRGSSSGSDGNAHLYILIVMSFYGIFLLGIALGYLRSKRREKRRSDPLTRLLHEETRRQWTARLRPPLACALCSAEQSSVSSLSSDTRLRIEEEEPAEEKRQEAEL